MTAGDVPWTALAILWGIPIAIVVGYLLRDKHDDR